MSDMVVCENAAKCPVVGCPHKGRHGRNRLCYEKCDGGDNLGCRDYPDVPDYPDEDCHCLPVEDES